MTNDRFQHILWDGRSLGNWTTELEGAAAVINLSGKSVDCRYNASNRRQIYSSRLDSTRILGEAISKCRVPPRVWINSSSATIYRHATDRPMDEVSGEIGQGFSVDVCCQWERALEEAPTRDVRKVALRLAMVLADDRGSVYTPFARMTRLGLGGTLGEGSQYMSWIHWQDLCRSLNWILDNDSLEGAVNVASPEPIPNKEFMKIFREVFKKHYGLPARAWMIEIGTFFLRTESELLLKSRRVVPKRLLDSGFQFLFPGFREALRDIRKGSDV